MSATRSSAPRAPRGIPARTAVPVPAGPPAVGDVVRHGFNVGLGALGLVRHALGATLARTTTKVVSPPTPPTTADILPGAVVGLGILVERRVRSVGSAVTQGASGVARSVGAPEIVQRALRPVEDVLWSWNEVARREQARNRAEASALVPALVQQAAENVVAQLDFERLVRQIPVADIVAQVDVEAVVARIDLGGVIRESTVSVGSEAVDALREQGMTLDVFAARVVDRVLFRRRPRQLELRSRS
ncbi:MAG: hypothetical protein ACHQIG_11700 [Acidimicrobiia bacterium]